MLCCNEADQEEGGREGERERERERGRGVFSYIVHTLYVYVCTYSKLILS